ncbi:hypothetical protein J3Q64DRAFT_1759205 [Phycomyces blakesleeanus]|uniref:Secreted protein n=1 Tax=Phycomyces blakesleeanus TaxID=4837 RepID=A0ABR3AS42_PHYBL
MYVCVLYLFCSLLILVFFSNTYPLTHGSFKCSTSLCCSACYGRASTAATASSVLCSAHTRYHFNILPAIINIFSFSVYYSPYPRSFCEPPDCCCFRG